jgi:hypothetical protein
MDEKFQPDTASLLHIVRERADRSPLGLSRALVPQGPRALDPRGATRSTGGTEAWERKPAPRPKTTAPNGVRHVEPQLAQPIRQRRSPAMAIPTPGDDRTQVASATAGRLSARCVSMGDRTFTRSSCWRPRRSRHHRARARYGSRSSVRPGGGLRVGARSWLRGGLALAGVAGAITREREADIYNDDIQCGCLPGQPRSARCSTNRDIGNAAQTIGIAAFVGSGIATAISGVLLFGGSRSKPRGAGNRVDCGVAGVGLVCGGTF